MEVAADNIRVHCRKALITFINRTFGKNFKNTLSEKRLGLERTDASILVRGIIDLLKTAEDVEVG